jgi:hypothetical protein
MIIPVFARLDPHASNGALFARWTTGVKPCADHTKGNQRKRREGAVGHNMSSSEGLYTCGCQAAVVQLIAAETTYIAAVGSDVSPSEEFSLIGAAPALGPGWVWWIEQPRTTARRCCWRAWYRSVGGSCAYLGCTPS